MKPKGRRPPLCVILEASENFYLENVLIFKVVNGYRLFVMHRGVIETARTYLTLKGAKIAFFQKYKWKRLDPSIKLTWNPCRAPSN